MGYITPVTANPELPELGGTLYLEDGTRFEGVGFGAAVSKVGEVVFTTGMVGYPESLTDPSYRGQILTLTYPQIGNYGVPAADRVDAFGLPTTFEANGIQVRGLVVRGTTRPHHWAQERTLEDWLRSEKVPGVAGIDTRRLTEHLRSQGVLRGVLDVGDVNTRPSTEDLAQRLRQAPQYADEPLVREASVQGPIAYPRNGAPWVVVLDCGVKVSMLRALLVRNLSVLRLPYDHPIPETWDGRRVAGLLIGNGPGDPATLEPVIEELRQLPRRPLPTLGICLGHQLVALARGGRAFKLKYGHRGQNKTICFSDGRAMIVSENHGYAVDPASLRGTGLKAWATNPDDGTLEGLRAVNGRILALQGHPEGHPGPQEASFVFDRFAEMVRRKGR